MSALLLSFVYISASLNSRLAHGSSGSGGRWSSGEDDVNSVVGLPISSSNIDASTPDFNYIKKSHERIKTERRLPITVRKASDTDLVVNSWLSPPYEVHYATSDNDIVELVPIKEIQNGSQVYAQVDYDRKRDHLTCKEKPCKRHILVTGRKTNPKDSIIAVCTETLLGQRFGCKVRAYSHNGDIWIAAVVGKRVDQLPESPGPPIIQYQVRLKNPGNFDAEAWKTAFGILLRGQIGINLVSDNSDFLGNTIRLSAATIQDSKILNGYFEKIDFLMDVYPGDLVITLAYHYSVTVCRQLSSQSSDYRNLNETQTFQYAKTIQNAVILAATQACSPVACTLSKQTKHK